MSVRTLLVALAIPLLGGCLSAPEEPAAPAPPAPSDSETLPGADFPAGRVHYDYVGFDRLGRPVVRGSLVIDFPEDPTTPRFGGRWKLTGKNDPELGPQIGTGTLAGFLEDRTISIDLNPGWADNNVYLHGRLDDAHVTSFGGTWNYSTFVGPVNDGRFTARRVR